MVHQPLNAHDRPGMTAKVKKYFNEPLSKLSK